MTPALTLALDASTSSGTAALLCGSAELGAVDVAMRNVGREALLPAIAELMQTSGRSIDDVERIVCGRGPGSFTGLRIAASMAKAVAFSRDGRKAIPFYGVSSLMLIVAGNEVARQPGRYVAVLDAQRGDVYAAAFDVGEQLDIAQLDGTSVRPRNTIEPYAARLGARLVGPDYAPRYTPHARGVARLEPVLDAATPADLATWEPEYGRVAAALERWEEAHGKPLRAG